MSIARSLLVVIFLFLGAVFAITANATVWANRTVFDTDRFVTTVDRALDDPTVQQSLATRLSDTLIERGDVQARLRKRLPEGLQFMAPILAAQAHNIAYDICLRLLQNDQVQAALNTAVRVVHQQVLHIIEDTGAVSVEGNQVVLDLGEVLRQVAEELNVNAQGLLGNLDLPPDAGQIVLIDDAPRASAIQELLQLHNTIAWLTVGAAVAMFALAILIAKDRRGALRTSGLVLVAAGLLSVIFLIPIRPIVAAFAKNPDSARIIFDALLRDFRIQSFLLIFLGLAVVLLSVMLGRGAMATAVRGSVRRDPETSAPDWGAAVRSSATPLRALGFVIGALVLAAWPDPTDRVYVTTFILMALYFIGLWLMTGDGEWATSGRQRLAGLWSPGDDQNDSIVGRHAGPLRIAGSRPRGDRDRLCAEPRNRRARRHRCADARLPRRDRVAIDTYGIAFHCHDRPGLRPDRRRARRMSTRLLRIHRPRRGGAVAVAALLLVIVLGARDASASPCNGAVWNCRVGLAAGSQLQDSAEQALADKYRPVIFTKQQNAPCDSDGEAYYPVAVETVLGSTNTTLYDDGTLVKTAPVAGDLYRKGAGLLPRRPGGSGEAWMRIRRGVQVDHAARRLPSSTRTSSTSRARRGSSTPSSERGDDRRPLVLQYWLYYYFNDWNNSHEGDWEFIQLVFNESTAADALASSPAKVVYSQHGGGETRELVRQQVAEGRRSARGLRREGFAREPVPAGESSREGRARHRFRLR